MLDPKWWRRRQWGIVVVHTRDDRSIRGLVAEVTRAAVVLRAASVLSPEGDQALAGEIAIPADNVSWWQDLGQEREPTR